MEKSDRIPVLPRLKAIHSQKLHRPGTGKADAYANLQLILSKPMRTTLIETIARVSGINVVNLLSRGYGEPLGSLWFNRLRSRRAARGDREHDHRLGVGDRLRSRPARGLRSILDPDIGEPAP